MKFCYKCGKELDDNVAFCSKCGAAQKVNPPVTPQAPVEPAQPAQPAQQAPVNPRYTQQPVYATEPVAQPAAKPVKEKKPKKEKAPKEAKPKKKVKVGLIVGIVVGVLVLAAVGTAAYLSFPLKVTLNNSNIVTHENKLTETFTIQSNQVVKSVYYAVNPTTPDKLDEYQDVGKVKGSFKLDVTVSDINLAPGMGKIYFYVETMFSKKVVSVEYDYDLGYYAKVDMEDVRFEEDGIGVVTNRLIVKFKEKIDAEELKETVSKKFNGKIVGINYFTNEVQILFKNRNIDEAKNDLEQDNDVDDVDYEYVFKNDGKPIDGFDNEEVDNPNHEYDRPEMPDPIEIPTGTVEPTTDEEEETSSEEVTTEEPSSDEETSEEETSDEETTEEETSDEETSEEETSDEETTEEATTEEATTEEPTTEEPTTEELTTEEPTTEEPTTEEPTTEEPTTEEPTTEAPTTEEVTTEDSTTGENPTVDWDVEDPYADGSYEWNLLAINAPKVWKYTLNRIPVKVGVMDSYVDYEHSDLGITPDHILLMDSEDAEHYRSTFEKGFKNHVHSDAYCSFCSFMNHGSHVSGTIGALINNGNVANGVSNNVELYFANQWKAEYDEYYGFEYYDTSYSFSCNLTSLVLSGVKVINYSVGASTYYTGYNLDDYAVNYMNRVFESLCGAGYDFVFVKAAGNDNMPADEDILVTYLKAGAESSKHTLVVGSIQNTVVPVGGDGQMCYTMSSFSNYGELVDIVAPGSYIYSTFSRDNYGYMSGTSMAAPHVTGVCALIYAANPNLTSEQVIDIVKNCVSTYAVKNGELYPVIDAELCVVQALKMLESSNQKIEEAEVAPSGIVNGTILNAETKQSVGVCSLVFTNTNGKKFIATTDENGHYETLLDVGTYALQILSSDYVYETLWGIEVTEGEVTYNATVALIEGENTEGTISGTILNAFDASAIEGTKLYFRQGVNNRNGEVVYTCRTDNNGNYEAELPAGNYTVEAVRKGYESTYFNVNVVGGQDTDNQNGSISPILSAGEVRIVLTWGERPSDLDAHLWGPYAEDTRFHVYYDVKSKYINGEKIAALDVDATSSYGPETITLSNLSDGRYVYCVFDFSNRRTHGGYTLAESEATVNVYMAGGQSYTFTVPYMAGNTWRVFAIENGRLIPLNSFSETYDNYSEMDF